MKKYIFKTAICAALALPLTTACELDQLPEGTITTEQSWEKVEDANNYYVGLLAAVTTMCPKYSLTCLILYAVLLHRTKFTSGPLPPASLAATLSGPATMA